MSGAGLPYHLRTNKAIERDIFFELLHRLKLPLYLQDYQYISLGGPMLEDLRILHQKFDMRNLNSIERDSAALTRQEFNRPFFCVNCKKSTTSQFVSEFEPSGPSIIWLDYTDTKWQTQFTECHNLLGKMSRYDILKITLNANPDSLEGKTDEEKLKNFKDRAGSIWTSQNLITNDVVLMDRLAKTLANIFDTVSQEAINLVENSTLKPLTLFRYVDNRHQMLTITCIVLPDDADAFRALLEESRLIGWPHLASSWEDIHEIAVPDLTAKERQIINQLLPNNENNSIRADQVPFKIFENELKNQRALDNYARYYRHIPNFQRLVS